MPVGEGAGPVCLWKRGRGQHVEGSGRANTELSYANWFSQELVCSRETDMNSL